MVPPTGSRMTSGTGFSPAKSCQARRRPSARDLPEPRVAQKKIPIPRLAAGKTHEVHNTSSVEFLTNRRAANRSLASCIVIATLLLILVTTENDVTNVSQRWFMSWLLRFCMRWNKPGNGCGQLGVLQPLRKITPSPVKAGMRCVELAGSVLDRCSLKGLPISLVQLVQPACDRFRRGMRLNPTDEPLTELQQLPGPRAPVRVRDDIRFKQSCRGVLNDGVKHLEGVVRHPDSQSQKPNRCTITVGGA